MGFTSEEKKLLKRLASGELDGFVGDNLTTTRGSTVWKAIKNGVPVMFKQGPGGRFFNGKENERFEGVLHTLQEWVTDEQKLEFLRKFGWLMKDEAVKAYSAKFKPKKLCLNEGLHITGCVLVAWSLCVSIKLNFKCRY